MCDQSCVPVATWRNNRREEVTGGRETKAKYLFPWEDTGTESSVKTIVREKGTYVRRLKSTGRGRYLLEGECWGPGYECKEEKVWDEYVNKITEMKQRGKGSKRLLRKEFQRSDRSPLSSSYYFWTPIALFCHFREKRTLLYVFPSQRCCSEFNWLLDLVSSTRPCWH